MPIITDTTTEIEINGTKFKALPNVDYYHDYIQMFKDVEAGIMPEIDTCRALILGDLFFILYFVMGITAANDEKGFVVGMCREVQEGPETMTLDVWAREHFKSTIITIAETLQYHLKNPEECTGIFAYARPLAKAFLRSIKVLCEESTFLQACFPDVLWDNPQSQAPKWSEDDGLVFKRKASGRKESTIEAWGLVEGMPTGRHFNRRIYDDIETQDIADNPDQLDKCFSKFEMSDNLGMNGDIERIIGTFYSHYGPIVRVQEKKDLSDNLMYHTRIVASTEDGTPNGLPVLISQERMDKLRMSQHFNSQQLCDPTPVGTRKLDGSLLVDVDQDQIPDGLFKFMIVDPAGDGSDSWGLMVLGVEPEIDELGASNIYILDAVIDDLGEVEGTEEAVRMYLRNGIIDQVGVEKVALSTTEVHIANALAKHKRKISVEDKTLVILKPAGRKKVQRIESALAWPLYNGKLFVSSNVQEAYRQRFKVELDQFPFGKHEDGIDGLSYIYDMLHDFGFKYRVKRKHKNLNPLQRGNLRLVGGRNSWQAA